MTTGFELAVIKAYQWHVFGTSNVGGFDIITNQQYDDFEVYVIDDSGDVQKIQSYLKRRLIHRNISQDDEHKAGEVARKMYENDELKKVEFNFISKFYKSLPFNFGVEIEFYTNEYMPTGVIDDLLFETNIKEWEIKTDSSCGRRKDESGLELVSPILSGEDGFNQIKESVKFIKGIGGKINNHCGLHVHIGAEDLSTKRIYDIVKRYHENEHYIDSFMAMSRRKNNNLYCKSTYDSFDYQFLSGEFDPDKFINVSDLVRHQGSRYCKVNLHAYRLHGTIEFRQHGSTLSSKRIIMWVRFLQEFVKYTTADNVQDLGWDKLFYSDEVRKYYTQKRDGLASREDKLCSHGYTYEGSWQ